LNLYIVFLVRLLIVLRFVCIYVVNQLAKVDIWTKDVAFVWEKRGQCDSWSVGLFRCVMFHE